MSDVNCPHCGAEQEINHDDGYGYDEGTEYQQECVECEKEFSFFTQISFSYSVYCPKDEHDMEQSPIPKYSNLWSCSKCDYYESREVA